MFIYKKENFKVPVKVWMKEKDYYSDRIMVEQVENLAQLPFSFGHIAIMPDSHQGYGMPIGGILATEKEIIPNAVGVDISCGVSAVKTSLNEIKPETIRKIFEKSRKLIPLGFNRHKNPQDKKLMPEYEKGNYFIVPKHYNSALKQIGTLGGGNHFIEIQKGSDNHIWIMVHSGSRNLGKQVADYYNRVAINLNKEKKSTIPESWELASLPINSNEGEMYIREMRFCMKFAFSNRKLIMERLCHVFEQENKCNFDPSIDISHNYAEFENHFGKNLWIHRKGATLADKETIGIVPGSQGSPSYIVKGKGNVMSFKSCSHGAGRKMGRNQARKNLDLGQEQKILNEKGIIHSIRTVRDLDEATGSYKDISEVMEQQKDLVDILIKLNPLGVIKA